MNTRYYITVEKMFLSLKIILHRKVKNIVMTVIKHLQINLILDNLTESICRLQINRTFLSYFIQIHLYANECTNRCSYICMN